MKKYKILLALFLAPVLAFGQGITNKGANIQISSGAMVQIRGSNFAVLNESGTLTNDGTIALEGNWSNDVAAGVSGSGIVSFEGATQQSVGGTQASDFEDVTIDNAADVALGADQNIAGTLTFSQGDLVLNDYDLSLTGTSNAAENNCFVTNGVGSLIQNVGATDKIFHVKSLTGSYAPATLQSGATDLYGVSLFDNVTDNGQPGGTAITTDVVNLSWGVTYQGEGMATGVDLTLQWDGADEASPSFDRANSGISLYDAGWTQFQMAGAATGSDPYTRSYSGIPGFGTFAIGDIESGFPIPPILTWTGNISPVWDLAANWSPQEVPSHDNANENYRNAVIPSSPAGANWPEVYTQSASVLDLTVEENAELSVENGGLLTVHETLENHGTVTVGESGALTVGQDGESTPSNLNNYGDFIVDASATGDAASGSLITYGNITNTGTMTYKRLVTGNWHFVSSPMNAGDVTAGEFGANRDPVTGLNHRFYKYEDATYDLTEEVPIGTVVDNFTGYRALFASPSTLVTLEGTFNTGEQTTTTHPNSAFWHMTTVGNPYPSAVDWDVTSGWVRDDLDGGFYIVDSNGEWLAYQRTGDGVPDGATSVIPSMQGFYVSSYGGPVNSATFKVNDKARVHSNMDYFKNKEKNFYEEKIRLIANKKGTIAEEAIVAFNNEATENFDGAFDAFKLFDWHDGPQLYTKSSEALNLSINYMPKEGKKRTIPLYFRAGIPGEYNISMKELSFDNLVTAYIEDLKTKKMAELSLNEPYRFLYNTGDADLRFRIHLRVQPTADYLAGSTGVNDIDNGITGQIGADPDIYAFQKSVYIDLSYFDATFKASAHIYDMGGKLLQIKDVTGRTFHKIDVATPGTYVVKLISDDNVTCKPVIISN